MAKVGRPRNLDSPEQLYELFKKYKEDVKANPRIKSVFGGKEFEERAEPLERPLTMEGFEIFCWDEVGVVEDYFMNRDKRYSEFTAICSRIRKEIREDQITGGMVGQYNASITQRLNNLKEQVEQNVTETKIINLGNGINPNE
jgi:DNA polymerase II small subunit/DNA polymerase delta subunit B